MGLLFFAQGIPKLLDLRGTAENFESIGIPFSQANALFTAGSEVLGGVLLLLGLFTRAASVLLGLIMVGALAYSVFPQVSADQTSILGFTGDFLLSGAWLTLLILVGLFFAGSGRFALDGLLQNSASDRKSNSTASVVAQK